MIYIRSLLANIFYYSSIVFFCLGQLPVALLPQKCSIFYWDKIAMPASLFWIKFFAGMSFEIRGKENIRSQNGILVLTLVFSKTMTRQLVYFKIL